MAQTIQSFNISPTLSLKKPVINGRNRHFPIKSMLSGERREVLDPLQSKSKNQQPLPPPPPPPKKRLVQVTPTGLWDRFPTARTVQQMMDTMESIMEDPYAYGGGWQSPAAANDGGRYGRGRTPWEIKQGQNEYKMRFDMPGMTKRDVKVWVEEKMLVVKAEKAAAAEVDGGGEVESEWSAKSYGKYSYRIALPENVEVERIKAEVRDGVLYISIPNASAKAKVLDINVD